VLKDMNLKKENEMGEALHAIRTITQGERITGSPIGLSVVIAISPELRSPIPDSRYPEYMTDRDLLARIRRSNGGRAGYKQLVRELGLGGGRERRMLIEQLARMTARGDLAHPEREMWCIPEALNRALGTRGDLIAGKLSLHRDGFGFVRPNPGQKTPLPAGEDVFIPPDAIASAMQGDQVLVELLPPREDGRRAGSIVRVLERQNPTVVGTFRFARSNRHRGHAVFPFDERMNQPILIPLSEDLPEPVATVTPHRVQGDSAPHRYESLEGLIVDVEITKFPTADRPAEGRILEVLGHPDDFGVDVEMMIRKHRLPRVFPDEVLAEASKVSQLDPEEAARRRDFRHLPIVTIDGETARDFDDAVLVTETDAGFELQVHIADVAHYVRPATPLDLEARLRGNSVYFPDRAIPMLPHELSTGICSLRPNEDRLTLCCILQLDREGRIQGYEILEGLIRSAARMTYTQVHKILDGDTETRAQFAALVPSFERMRHLAGLMNQRRQERGSIDFDLPEPVIHFDDQGQMSGVTRSERSWANRLIEEFMLAANECVASWLEDHAIASLYRIHERPQPRRVVQFEELAASFGHSLGIGPAPVKRHEPRGDRRDAQRRGRKTPSYEVPEEIPVTPRMYQKLAQRIEGLPEERILSYLMLRSLEQARYNARNEGHFALAAPSYTHFTSPIRRYPDLIIHRLLKAMLGKGIEAKAVIAKGRLASPWSHTNEGTSGAPKLTRKAAAAQLTEIISLTDLEQIAEECSQNERRAAEAERELVEWKKVRYMSERVGEDFDALLLNPTKYGLFVELTDLFVEGLVPIDSLRDDRYIYHDSTHEVIGQRTGRTFRAGDRLHVLLDRVLPQERKLQFTLLEDGLPLTAHRAPKVGKKSLKREQKAKKNRRSNPAPWSKRAPKAKKTPKKKGRK